MLARLLSHTTLFMWDRAFEKAVSLKRDMSTLMTVRHVTTTVSEAPLADRWVEQDHYLFKFHMQMSMSWVERNAEEADDVKETTVHTAA